MIGDLSQPHVVERLRRSVVMLSPGQPGLVREDAIAVLDALQRALVEVARLRAE